jgi:heptosyltransferase-3
MNQKILIFRRGSLGEAIVSLPALIAIRTCYPKAELRILSNTPIMGSAAPISSLLGQSDLISDYFYLPPGGGRLTELLQTMATIRTWSPDKLIYLSEPSKTVSLIKEYLYFKACGIKSIQGLPVSPAHRKYIQQKDNLWESESARLLRVLQLPQPDKIKLTFTKSEETDAETLIQSAFNKRPFITLCIGGKLPDKDWGNNNWCAVLNAITSQYPDIGLLLIGAGDERERSTLIAKSWNGIVLNICGETDPRISALAMKYAEFYLGHDTGPMHLAALMGLPCVALFSARTKPGVWFPFGYNHSIFYPWDHTKKVSNKTGFRIAGASILSISTDEVIKSTLKHLKEGLKRD